MKILSLAICANLFILPALAFSESAKTQSEMRLGMIAPLSGDFAYQGRFIQRGVELALEDLRKEGKQIRVSYEDACLPKEALSAAKKLLAQGIDALVGSYCVIGMVPMSRLFENDKVLAFHTSVVPNILLESGDYVVTTNVAIEDEARSLAKLARQKLRSKRAGIFYFPSDWGADYSDFFKEEFENNGGEVVESALTQLSQMDFRAELTRMRAKGVDVIFAAHISSALGNMVKQARQLGIDAPFLSTNEAEDPQFFEAAGEASEGMIILTPEPSNASHNVQSFRSRYQARFGTLPPVIATNAYDATRLAADAISSCSHDRECAKDFVYQVSDYDGASGSISIERDGRSRKDFVMKIAKNQFFVSHSF